MVEPTGRVIEPLCLTTLRFMAGLRRAYLLKDIPPFHSWLRTMQRVGGGWGGKGLGVQLDAVMHTADHARWGCIDHP
jgi:hypothetical protein